MTLLESPHVKLRALEIEDIEVLYKWENDTDLWGVSNTLLPFSHHVLREFIEAQRLDIYTTRQTRFVIESLETGCAIGAIDLYDFDPFNLRAGVGILIYDKTDRGKGYASEAIEILRRYCKAVLSLNQLYCDIPANNEKSMRLFESCGFKHCGTRRLWVKSHQEWIDDHFYQCIL